MKLIDLISYGLVLCPKLCIILMSMCFIEIDIIKILPVLLLYIFILIQPNTMVQRKKTT
jgi:hypothetical protein